MKESHLPAGANLHTLVLLGLVLLASSGMSRTTSARQATSAATPVSETCDVAPRSVAELIALIGPPPGYGEQVLEPQPLSPGAPADSATTTAITAMVRELEACLNAGDQLRFYALFSDDSFRKLPKTDEIVAEVTSLETAMPTPAAVGQRQVLIGPWHVQHLSDGRVMAAVLFSFEDEVKYPSVTKALFFVHQDGRWLIEEMTDFIWVEGDAGLAPVADIVGPPPGT